MPVGFDFSTIVFTSIKQTWQRTFITGIIELSHLLLSSSNFIYKSLFKGIPAGYPTFITTDCG